MSTDWYDEFEEKCREVEALEDRISRAHKYLLDNRVGSMTKYALVFSACALLTGSEK